MTSLGLSHDPLWPRAGGWPLLSEMDSSTGFDVALLGVPASQTSLSPTNAHETPGAIREALKRYSPSLISSPGQGHTDGDLTSLVCVDFGDSEQPDSPAGEARTIAMMAHAVAASRLSVALGGDNSVTVAAALGAWGSRIETAGLITLDAHYDLRDGISNGSPVRRLIESGLDPRRIVQIGIQDFANSAAYAARARELGITVIHRDELAIRPLSDIVNQALEVAGNASGPIHVDIDVDVCDRSVAPGCPASVPGGISAFELRHLTRQFAQSPLVESFDITEIDALADTTDQRTIRLAALCVLEMMAGLSQR